MNIAKVALMVILGLLFVFDSIGVMAQAPGGLDITFGPAGTGAVFYPPDVAVNHYETVLQADGKIVSLLGENDDSNPVENMLVRLNPDGSVDTSFGVGGYVYLTIGGAGDGRFYRLGNQLVNGEERFVVAGWGRCGRKTCLRAERYRSDGSLDASFGNSGVVAITGSTPTAVAVQSDQKILLAGSNGTVVRLLPNGSVDSAFGSSGISTAASVISVSGMKPLSNGRILLCGSVPRGTSSDLAVVRLNSNGSLDDGGRKDSTPGDSFGNLGKASVDFGGFGDYAYAVAVDSLERIVAVGQAQIGGSAIANNDAVIARFLSNGLVDTSFGTLGKVTLDIGGRQDLFKALAIQADGSIVVTGEGRAVGREADTLTARYLSDGFPDAGFGNNGYTLSSLFPGYDQAQSVLIQNDPSCGGCPKLVIAGGTAIPGSFILRYWP